MDKIKLKKIGTMLGIILLILTIAFVMVPNLIIVLMDNETIKEKLSAMSLSFGDPESIGIIYGNTRELIEWEGEDFTEQEITDYKEVEGQNIPVYEGTQLYCLDFGTDFWTSENPKYSVETLIKYGSITRYSIPNPNTSITWARLYDYKYEEHVETEHDGDVTYPWLIKDGELDMLTDEYIDLAYILTSPEIGQYNDEKQIAVWAREGQVAANDLYKEAEQYKEYYQATQVERGSTDLPDLNIQGSVDDIKTMVHYAEGDEGTIIIGPINLTYINKNNDDVAFGGISSMYFRGYSLSGEKIEDNIEIEKYFDSEGNEHDLKFFTPEEDSFVDHNEQSYPDGEGEFYVSIKNPNSGKTSADEDFISELSLCIGFKWMTINDALASTLKAYQYTVDWYNHEHIMLGEPETFDLGLCRYVSRLLEDPLQEVLNYYGGVRELFTTTVVIDGFDITMDLAGTVWEDGVATKESIADGVYTTSGEGVDKPLSNIKVSLYASDSNSSEGEFVTYTYTDEDGNYLFENLNPLLKYYVAFEYNGQQYLPTDYLKNAHGSAKEMAESGAYNGSDEWHTTSKGTETESEREALNQTFVEIGSSPANYTSSDSLGSGQLVAGGKNEAFSQYELMGFVLDGEGNYSKDSNLSLIDGFYTAEGGNITETSEFQKGRISELIEQYMEEYEEEEKEKLRAEAEEEYNQKVSDWNSTVNSYVGNPDIEDLEEQRANGLAKLEKQNNKRLESIEKMNIVPDYDEMIDEVYSEIAGGDEQTWRKLQFIEDCKITSYTQNTSGEKDLYPVFDDFYINNIMENSSEDGTENSEKEYESIEEKRNDSYDQTEISYNGKTYKPIYEGQFFINQGLWRRQETDLALRKDVAYAATRINGKTEVYKYNKRNQESDYWEIQLRMRDYNNYYAGVYERDLYPADYTYRAEMNGADASKELELYVTYKITVRNSSTSIVSQITEVVDYYDKDYEYIDNLSWVMYGGTSEISVSEDAYYNTINSLSLQVQNAKAINSNSSSKYGTESEQSGMEAQYNAVYIRGLEDRKLESGEEAYIYLTFKVRSDSNGPVILDDDNSLKQNYVEINGYTTYYKDGTALPNGQTKGSGDAAGIIDIDSTPGNLKAEDLSGEKYEKNFEDDTDRAKSIKVTLNNDAIRSINGTVWEDKRTQDASNAMIGDGIRQDEIGIAGVTVELVEKLENGNEHVWQTLTTGANGKYEFKTDENANAYIIPGNYVVRFYYGNNNATVLTNSHGGSNVVSYNGQDFKSTIYQQGLSNYTEKYYNIQAADAFESNISDAKDSWERRQEVNGYSISNVTNHKAEVLASPYASEINETLINELIENTNMSAETAIIVFEGEYNRTKTDGEKVSNGAGTYLHGNDVNGNYTLNNLDFGLVERPKAQLELNKKVSNVKITLANGSTLFDTTADIPAADRKWLEGKSYNLINQMEDKKYEEYYNQSHRYAYRTEIDNLIQGTINNSGLIEFNMDNELMQGATISVTYDLTVTNASETDYLGQDFYYKGTGASEMVTTSADSVLDYLANNLSYKEEYNIGWSEVESFEPGEVADVIANTDVNIVKTEGLAGELQPGESKSVSLILTQIMSSNNSQDDKAYDNIAEISAVSNTAGRRMAYSIQANQDPKAENPAEVDTSKAEHIIVIPPTGVGEIVVYIALSIAVLAVIIVGIIFIKKKVLTNN